MPELPISEKTVGSYPYKSLLSPTRYTTRNASKDHATLERIQLNRRKAFIYAARGIWWENAGSLALTMVSMATLLIGEKLGLQILHWVLLALRALPLYLSAVMRYQAVNHFGEENHR